MLRTLFKQLVCAAALLFAVGASAAEAERSGPVEVVLWHSYTGAEQQVFEGAIHAFNASRDDVQATALFIPYTVFADKLTSAIGAGKGPDLFVFAHDRLGDWANWGLVEPVQHFLTPEDVERFSQPAIEALTVPQGSRMLYGLPLAMKSVALLYDAAKVAEPPRTLDELVAEARKLTGGGQYGFVMDWASTYTEAGFLHAFGGMVLDDKGRPALDARGNAEALFWVRKLHDEGLLPREVTGAMVSSLFNDRKAAMIVTGPWFLGDIKDGIDARVAPLPAGPAGAAKPYLSVEALIMSSRSSRKAEAFEVMRHLTSDEVAVARLEKAGQPVANKQPWKGVKDQRLQGFRAQAELAVPMPSAPAMRHVWTPMDAAIMKAVGQGAEAESALAEAQRRVAASVEASERTEPIEVQAKGAEKALDQARWQVANPDELIPDSRWEAMVLTFEQGESRLLGKWCAEKRRGFADAVACPIPKALADLADLAVAREGEPALIWNAAKTEVVIAARAADGRVTMVKGGAPVKKNRTWQLVLGGLLALLALLAFIYRKQLRPHLGAYAYVFPAMAAVIVLVFVPFGYGLSLSFYDVTPTREAFVGLTNFIDILLARGAGDPHSFYYTAAITIVWTAANVFLHVAIGLFLALILQDPKLRFKKVYRVLLIVPWAIPNYITALIWKAMFNAEYGLINRVFSLGSFSWFQSPVTAFFANLATNVWLGFPFMMVTALGALQSIPKELYEAADVDGAGRWKKFTHVTLPLLKPAMIPAVILGVIWTFNLSFNVIYLVSGGAPDGATDILVTQAFRYAFEQYRYGYAAAYATIIFGILMTYTVITNRITKATEGAFE
ncbi:MAG: extracellular solute-binding protein [Myxococcales bacterium]|jgi:ABC-type sugar transport system permease subunit/maltose-binding protein MalE